MQSAVTIRTLDWQNPADRQAFIELPWQLYAPGNWIPPLKASLEQELGPDNLFFRHGRAQILLAERDGEPVGRVVASVDDQLVTPGIGHFGYFECIDDAEVAQALLHAAESWLAEQGRRTVHGPINLNVYNTYRLQTEGFDTRPFLGEPRALPYYAGLLAAAGYVRHAHWRSWDIPGAAMPMMDAHMRAMAQGDQNYRLHTLASHGEAMLPDLHGLAMEIFGENYGFAPIDLAEFLQVYQGMLLVFQHKAPEMLGVFYRDDRPAGFGLIYPDHARFFQQADGDAAALAGFGAAESAGIVLHTFGVVKSQRQTTLPYAMFAEAFDAIRPRQPKILFGALAKEGRTAYDSLGAPSRGYAVFARELP